MRRAQLLMSRSTERTINTGAIRTEGATLSAGTSLGKLSSSVLISSSSPLGCLAEPQSPEKPTQSASSPSALHEGSADGSSSFDTYRKLVAERVSIAERRRADAEDIITSVGPSCLFTHRRTHFTNAGRSACSHCRCIHRGICPRTQAGSARDLGLLSRKSLPNVRQRQRGADQPPSYAARSCQFLSVEAGSLDQLTLVFEPSSQPFVYSAGVLVAAMGTSIRMCRAGQC